MVFSSILFLYCFLPAFLFAYHIVGERLKNWVLLISSIAFYMWGAPQFVFILLSSLTVNFYIVGLMGRVYERKKLYLILSLFINVGLLGYFKYANFFVDNFKFVLSTFGTSSFHWTEIILPIGISFFTFQSLTYTIDVYRGVHKPLKGLHEYLLYILMFPQLIAGPIVRFSSVADDILNRKHNHTLDNKLYGVFLFVLGLSKKVLIANTLGEHVDTVFSGTIDEYSSSTLWVIMVAYTLQIYFDFSGYSDMAIGLGRIIGFKFPENFNNPYISQSITEFWRRWHITLGTWMRDYLYIPLGGNRVASKSRLYVNLVIVFLLSGFWHGANWTFIVWGAWHGLFLIFDRVFLDKVMSKAGLISRVVLTFFVVMIGWVFFRADSISDAIIFINRLFYPEVPTKQIYFDSEYIGTIVFSLVILFFGLTSYGNRLQVYFYSDKKSLVSTTFLTFLSAIMLIICTSYITASGFNPFIYFRF